MKSIEIFLWIIISILSILSLILIIYFIINLLPNYFKKINERIDKYFTNHFRNKKLNNVIKKSENIKQKRIFTNRDDLCCICLEKGGTVYLLLDCGHIYHKKCLKQWIKNKNECPLCRQNVIIV